MKKNFPVTGIENDYDDDNKIISTTATTGVITGVNDEFVKIAGFFEEELPGKGHNIVRHPDMPQTAFADLWNHLKHELHGLTQRFKA